jgi:hypothetical protein
VWREVTNNTKLKEINSQKVFLRRELLTMKAYNGKNTANTMEQQCQQFDDDDEICTEMTTRQERITVKHTPLINLLAPCIKVSLISIFFTVSTILVLSFIILTASGSNNIDDGNNKIVPIVRYLRCHGYNENCVQFDSIVATTATTAQARTGKSIKEIKNESRTDKNDEDFYIYKNNTTMQNDDDVLLVSINHLEESVSLSNILPSNEQPKQHQQQKQLYKKQPFVQYKPNNNNNNKDILSSSSSLFECYYDIHLTKYRCYYKNHDYTTSLFQLLCTSDTFIEPTSTICSCYLDVSSSSSISTTDNNNNGYSTISSYQRCTQCSIAQSDNVYDGFWDISYDCSNILSSSSSQQEQQQQLHHVTYVGNGNAGPNVQQRQQPALIEDDTKKKSTVQNSAVVVVVNSNHQDNDDDDYTDDRQRQSNSQKPKGIITTFVFTSSLDGGDGTIHTSTTTTTNSNDKAYNDDTTQLDVSDIIQTTKEQRILSEKDIDDDTLNGRHGFEDLTLLQAYADAAKEKLPSTTVEVTTTVSPTIGPTRKPLTTTPSVGPSVVPTESPSSTPSSNPTNSPSSLPTSIPTLIPSTIPVEFPSTTPTTSPSAVPSNTPSNVPTSSPSSVPVVSSSDTPTTSPSMTPSTTPSSPPSTVPSVSPSSKPITVLSTVPSDTPSSTPSQTPIEDETLTKSIPASTLQPSGVANTVADNNLSPTISPTTTEQGYTHGLDPILIRGYLDKVSSTSTTIPPTEIGNMGLDTSLEQDIESKKPSTSPTEILYNTEMIIVSTISPTTSPSTTIQRLSHGLDPNLIRSYLGKVSENENK